MSLELKLAAAVAKALVNLVASEGIQKTIATPVGGTLIDHFFSPQRGRRKSFILSEKIKSIAKRISNDLMLFVEHAPTDKERSLIISSVTDFEIILQKSTLTLKNIIELKLSSEKIADFLLLNQIDAYASASRVKHITNMARRFSSDLLVEIIEVNEFKIELAKQILESQEAIIKNQEEILRRILEAETPISNSTIVQKN